MAPPATSRPDAPSGDEVVEGAARAGLVAKGALYAVIGLLAGRLAFVGGGGDTDASQRGAIAAVSRQPFGAALLAVLAAGLTGYALWRAVQAVRGSGGSSSLPAWLRRVSFAVRAVLYGGLAFLAWRTVLGGGSGSGPSQQSATARLLAAPFGQALVLGVAAIVVAVGLYQIFKGASRGFRDELPVQAMSGNERRWYVRIGVTGLVARGIVFAIIGGFLARAALTLDPDQGVGFDGALQQVAATPYGAAILAGVAVGLLVFGLFCFIQARYARVEQVS